MNQNKLVAGNVAIEAQEGDRVVENEEIGDFPDNLTQSDQRLLLHFGQLDWDLALKGGKDFSKRIDILRESLERGDAENSKILADNLQKEMDEEVRRIND